MKKRIECLREHLKNKLGYYDPVELLEKKYAPNKYHVTVTGQSLEKFDFYERLDEISRCAYLDKRSIEGAELIEYKKTYEIRITVSDYNSY